MMISLKKLLGTKSYFCVNSSLYHFRLYQILTISFQIVSTPYYIISDCINSENLIRKVVINLPMFYTLLNPIPPYST